MRLMEICARLLKADGTLIDSRFWEHIQRAREHETIHVAVSVLSKFPHYPRGIRTRRTNFLLGRKNVFHVRGADFAESRNSGRDEFTFHAHRRAI